MSAMQSTQKAAETQVVETSEFSNLLNKEFKPKTDQARDAVTQAVQTLAQQALASTSTISRL